MRKIKKNLGKSDSKGTLASDTYCLCPHSESLYSIPLPETIVAYFKCFTQNSNINAHSESF